ncbi:MAG: GntR family transcriptional regulator [Bryobacterales bacterium]|nr:GntR family transcriptional regulator [Bryobacterales bacterium]
MLKRGPLREVVLDAIRSAIFSGRFAPGEAIRELHMARELGVSQATVREALLQLEHRGIVVRTPNLGTTVVQLSSRELKERFELRVLLESMAAIQAAERMTAEELSHLRALNDEMSYHVAASAYYEASEADLTFHRFIWRNCGNAVLYHMLDQLTIPVFAFVSILRSRGSESLNGFMSHAPLVEAIAEKDHEKIRACCREILESSYRHFALE